MLCPTDHTKIDSIPFGPQEYPVHRLLTIKEQHERSVLSNKAYDKGKQRSEEQWASIIDELNQRVGWPTWQTDMSPIFDPNSPDLHRDVVNRLRRAVSWIFGRVWPPGHDKLKSTIDGLGKLLGDLMVKFDEHADVIPSYPDWLTTKRFYKIDEWNEVRWRKLLNKYEDHMDLLGDLVLEATRYGNYIAELVRDEIDPSFCFDEGLLLITRPGEMFRYELWRTQFTRDNLAQGEPYQNLEQFRRDRSSRDAYLGSSHS